MGQAGLCRQTNTMMNKVKWSALHKHRKYVYSELITYKFLHHDLATRYLKSQSIIYITPSHTVHVYLMITTISLSHLRHQVIIIRKASSLTIDWMEYSLSNEIINTACLCNYYYNYS